jgi:hypothetical protein
MEERYARFIPLLLNACDPDALHIGFRELQYVDFSQKDKRAARKRLLAVWGPKRRRVGVQSENPDRAAFPGLSPNNPLVCDQAGTLPLSELAVHSAVEDADPIAFERGRGPYQIARALEDRKALLSEGLIKTFDETQFTFDVFATSVPSFYLYEPAIKDAIERGVKFRFILLDHGPENRKNAELFYRVRASDKENRSRIKIATVAPPKFFISIQNHIDSRNGAKGSIDVRWWRNVFLNSFWVRDSRDSGNALGHIEVSYYGNLDWNPSLRFGKLSPKMVKGLQKQFDWLWQRAKETESK